MKHLLFCICFFGIISCFAQQNVYKGTIGNIPIRMELECYEEEGSCLGRYAYNQYLIDIPLRGSIINGKLTLNDGYFHEENPTEKNEVFTLERVGNKRLKGEWKHQNKIHSVELQLIHIEKEYTYELNNYYNLYKLPKLTWVRDSVAVINNKELVWFHEQYSGESLFRLGNGFTKENREYFNPILDEIHTAQAMQKLECNDWNDTTTQVNFASNNYISFESLNSIYCGGAHPNYGVTTYNFDLKKQTEIQTVSDLIKVDWYSALKSKYQNDQDLQEECEYFEYEGSYWEYAQWGVTEEGLFFVPSYSHAAKPCEIHFFLSFKELGVEPIE